MIEAKIVLQPDREKPVRNQHPWVFSRAIQSVNGAPQMGDVVTLVNEKGKFLARGYWNENSQIQLRLLTWQDEAITEAWWRSRIERALIARLSDPERLNNPRAAYRAINAENDFLPGLVIDVYANFAVLQALTAGIDARKDMLARLFNDVYNELVDHPLRGVFERSDVDARSKEGLKSANGVLIGDAPPDKIEIHEATGIDDGEVRYFVDVQRGHKTGFYLDQRENRALAAHAVANALIPPEDGIRMLNLFSYTGGFGIAGLYGAAQASEKAGTIVNVDASNDALELADENYKLTFDGRSEFDYTKQYELIQADVFDYLRDQVTERQKYDVIVCDPPKFAHNAGQVDRAARGYKDLNLQCFKLMNEGGLMMTFSCSGAISRDLFQKIVFGALADSGRQGQILTQLGAGNDHPVALTFPEGEYLKGLLLRVY